MVSETLLFLHILAAFALGAGVVMYSAFALGGPVTRSLKIVAEALWGAGGLWVLVLGAWLALQADAYGIWDGWVLASVVLWVLATASGSEVSRGVQPQGDGSALALSTRVLAAHWLRTALVVALLVVMIYKPGA